MPAFGADGLLDRKQVEEVAQYVLSLTQRQTDAAAAEQGAAIFAENCAACHGEAGEGNHEMGAPASAWHELFGPFNVHFTFKGVAFSLVDSGNATIDPHVYERLDGWLDDNRARTHAVLTHVPPIDPAGLRGGSFRSRKEAAKLLQKLGAGQVDALFLGHIHSYYAFSAAGVPSYISGGGGAIQETLDGIERHYLRVRASPERGIEEVAVVRVD